MAALMAEGRAVSDPPEVDVAQAAELTGLSKDAIRARIRRHDLASVRRGGRHRIPVAELRRQELIIEGARYRAVRERVESLEAQLRTALESRDHLLEELQESQTKVRMVWGMAQQRDRKLSRARLSRAHRRIRWHIRLPFRGRKPD
jgi:excisionase family DNA binding protein